MTIRPFFAVFLMAPAVLIPEVAQAHGGTGASFWTGLQHPIGGLDHVLAMVAVGLWAAMGAGGVIWAAPCAFVAAMVAGGGLAMAGVAFPGVEPMILASIIVLGALVGLSLRLPLWVVLPMMGLFGLVHGAAHGQEAPGGAMLSYAAGFVLATVGLHLAGLCIGLVLARGKSPGLVRLLGAGTATVGAALAVGG